MTTLEKPEARPPKGEPGRERGHISVAFMAGLLFVPFVIATGLLTEERRQHTFDSLDFGPLRGSLAPADRLERSQ